MTCKACRVIPVEERQRCKNNIKCAFHEDGSFDNDNWCCQTMHKLKDFARDYGTYYHEVEGRSSISTLKIPENDIFNGYITISTCTEGGDTDNAVMINPSEHKPLTLEIAEMTADYYEDLSSPVKRG